MKGFRPNQPEIVLRPFEEGDAEPFAAAARESAATVGRWMPWCRADYSADEARAWFAGCAQAMFAGLAYEFGVFATDGRELLGGVGLNQFNRQHNFGNLGYWIRETRQRRGIATGAALALAKFGLEQIGLTRIEIVMAQGNEPSAGVARRIGARFECVARNRLVLRDKSIDACVYSLVPGDIAAFAPILSYDVEIRQGKFASRDSVSQVSG